MKDIIKQAITAPLSEQIAMDAFTEIMTGKALEGQIAGFLIALKSRGETVTEIKAAAKTMLNNCNKISAPENAIDIVGTGGDGKGTLNISTAAALVVASSGVTVAKHGNKNISSQSGSADVLEKLGIKTLIKPSVVEKCISKANIGFMMAPVHHPAVRHVMPTRQMLGVRTIFNILGPLTNPAEVNYHLIGAYDQNLLNPMASVLKELGSKRAWLVHGQDGIDEISISGPTTIVQLDKNKIDSFEISPNDAGLPEHPLSSILGGTPEKNASELLSLINGKLGPYRDAVLFNSAAALVVAKKAPNLKKGVSIAANSIDSGATKSTFKLLSKLTLEKI